jgi:4-hydroxybenzoate polyprenyltransferase
VGAAVLSLTFGLVSFVLVLAGTGAGLAYDALLKRSPFSVAGYIAGFLILITWIWSVAGRLTPGFLILCPAGALLVSVAHLAQSLPDVETDRDVGARGLAVALGVEGSVAAIVLGYGVLAAGAAVLLLLAGAPWLVLCPAAGMIAVASTCMWLRASGYGRSARTRAFHAFGPALALLAISAAIACIRLGIL